MKTITDFGKRTLGITGLKHNNAWANSAENTVTSKWRHADKKSYQKFPNSSVVFFSKSTYYFQYLIPTSANFWTGLILLKINELQKFAILGGLSIKQGHFLLTYGEILHLG